MVRVLLVVLGGLAVFVLGVIAFNLSVFEAPHRDGPPRLIAHRGVHQTFDHENLESDTCTAERIHTPEHQLLENTVPSMEAAFASGADVVELDVHLTPDKQFAVFHDWTVDCRTEGEGATEEREMAYLKSLDIGHGYTADGGKTFPLRGNGVGLMPALPEVLERFPDRPFLVNFKSRRAEEGDALASLIEQHPDWRKSIWGVYGGAEPTDRSLERMAGLKGYTKRSMMDCMVDYELTGWTGIVPASCRNTVVLVPSNLAWAAWGWPHKFTKRMEKAGSEVILIGPFHGGDIGSSGVDTIEAARDVPRGYGGYVWTNRIEVVGPVLKGALD